jgi:ketosteroid isomerase-like protein
MTTTQMSTYEIGKQLVALCAEGKNHEAIQALYSPDIVSVEAGGPPGTSPETVGLEGVMAKGQWWVDNHEIHDGKVAGPWPKGDQFVVTFTYDITFKPTAKRFVMEEAALYTVRDGKIVREEFFYTMDG